MKRELSNYEIASYISYGVHFLNVGNDSDEESFRAVRMSGYGDIWLDADDCEAEIDDDVVEELILVLRPLSDLYKTITHNGVEEIPIVECAKVIIPNFEWIYHYDKRIGYSAAKGVCKNEDDEYFLSYTNNQFVFARNITTLCIPNNYKLFDYLNSRFIDYRNLIDDGLAVSVYDLGNNPYK